MDLDTPAARRLLHRRRLLAYAVAAAAGLGPLAAAAAEGEPRPSPLAVTLVASRILPACLGPVPSPPSPGGHDGPNRPPYLREIRLDGASPVLLVALRNTSRSPVRVWDEGNSWGFYNLRVEITAEDGAPLGRPLVVRRGPMMWFGNSPEYGVLPPGETLVRILALEGASGQRYSAWNYRPFPSPAAGGPGRRLRMRVVYEVAPSPQAARLAVWTGRAASPDDDYLVTVSPAR